MKASEFLELMSNDPVWIAKRKEMSEKAAQKEAVLRENQQPILAELKSAGFDYRDLWEMQNSSAPFSRAIPILLKHLDRDYMDATRATIARCLAAEEAKPYFDFLVAAYKREPLRVEEKHSATKEGLAVAVAATATTGTIPQLINLLRDENLGPSRVLLLSPLRR